MQPCRSLQNPLHSRQIPHPGISGTSRRSGTPSGKARCQTLRLYRCRSCICALSSLGSGQGKPDQLVLAGCRTYLEQGTCSSCFHLRKKTLRSLLRHPRSCIPDQAQHQDSCSIHTYNHGILFLVDIPCIGKISQRSLLPAPGRGCYPIRFQVSCYIVLLNRCYCNNSPVPSLFKSVHCYLYSDGGGLGEINPIPGASLPIHGANSIPLSNGQTRAIKKELTSDEK